MQSRRPGQLTGPPPPGGRRRAGPGPRPPGPVPNRPARRAPQEAERLRVLYQGADAFPDDLALAALPSGSFSVATRRKVDGQRAPQKTVKLHP